MPRNLCVWGDSFPSPTLCLGTQLSPAILVRGGFLSVASDDTNFRPAPLSRWDLGRLFAGLVRRRLAGKALGVRQTTDPQRSLLDQSPPLGMRRYPVRSLPEVYHVLCSELRARLLELLRCLCLSQCHTGADDDRGGNRKD